MRQKPLKLTKQTVKHMNRVLESGDTISHMMRNLGYAENVIYPALKRHDLEVVSFIMAHSKVEQARLDYDFRLDSLKETVHETGRGSHIPNLLADMVGTKNEGYPADNNG